MSIRLPPPDRDYVPVMVTQRGSSPQRSELQVESKVIKDTKPTAAEGSFIARQLTMQSAWPSH
jgi:hypothetical protein